MAGEGVRFLVLVRAKTEVLDRLPSVFRSPNEKGVTSSRRPQRKLIKGQSLASGCLDPGTSGSCEPQSSDGELGNRKKAVVISDGTDNDDGFVVIVGRVWVGTVLDDAGDRDWGPVDLRHKETAENSLVEGTVGTT